MISAGIFVAAPRNKLHLKVQQVLTTADEQERDLVRSMQELPSHTQSDSHSKQLFVILSFPLINGQLTEIQSILVVAKVCVILLLRFVPRSRVGIDVPSESK